MRVILVDDEEIALDLLARKLELVENIEIIGSFTNPDQALKAASKLKPDVLFLDIEMGEINGLELAEKFQEKLNEVDIVFVTAYSQYAIAAFEVNALDYLLKPIQDVRLAKTLNRLRNKVSQATYLGNQLQVSSFGSLQVWDESNRLLVWRTQKAKELFAYLLNSTNMAASRDLIMEDVFTDKGLEQATNLLHTTIYQLRKNFEKLGFSKGIAYFNETYQLKLPIKTDWQRLNQIIEAKAFDERKIREVIKVYQGDLLEQECYHWIVSLQLEYKEKVFTFLKSFAREKIGRQELNPILKASLDKLYFMDPYNDEVAQMMIIYYGSQGQSRKLKEFFQVYTQNLHKEINLRPSEATIDLYKRWQGTSGR